VWEGHAVSLAVSDPATGRALLGDRCHALLKAPMSPLAPAAPVRIESWADLPFNAGYISADAVGRIIAEWLALIRAHRIELVVGEFAPGAMLAARIADIPAVPVGMGWNLPPAVTPLPAIRFWEQPEAAVLHTAEARLLAAVNPALAAAGGHAIETLAALFDPKLCCLCAFPEVDHYLDRGQADYFGAIYQLAEGVAPQWSAGGAQRCFAYVNGRHKVLASLLAGLGEVGYASVIHLRGGPGQFGTALPSNAWLAPGPVRLDAVFAERPVVICQGPNTCCAALAAGCPVLLLPEHLEQAVLANQIIRQGLGLALSPHASPEEAGAVLRRLVEEPAFRTRAEAFAARYAGYDPGLAVEAVVGECLSLVG